MYVSGSCCYILPDSTVRFGFIWEFSMVTQQHPSHNAIIYIYIILYIYKKLPKWSRASCNFRLWSGNKNESVQYITNYTPENWWTDASRCPMKPVNALSRPCRKTGHQTHRFTRLFGAIYCQSFHHQYHPKHFNKTSWACHFRSSACSILKAIFALPPQICFPTSQISVPQLWDIRQLSLPHWGNANALFPLHKKWPQRSDPHQHLGEMDVHQPYWAPVIDDHDPATPVKRYSSCS